MAAKIARKLRTLMRNFGFEVRDDGRFHFVRNAKNIRNINKNGSKQRSTLWKIKEWVLNPQSSEVETAKLAMHANPESLNALVRVEIKRRFPSASVIEFRQSKDKGGIWCFVEFVRQGEGIDNRGIAGFRFLFLRNVDLVSLVVADRFWLGDYIPDGFLRTLPVTLKFAFGLKQSERENVHEVGIDLLKFALSYLGTEEHEPNLPLYRSQLGDISVLHTDKEVVIGSGLDPVKYGASSYDVPVQLLEDRLLLTGDGDQDDPLLGGDEHKAEELGRTLMEDAKLFAIRRYLQLPGLFREVSSENIALALTKEPANLLFLGCSITRKMKEKDFEAALKSVSLFVRELDRDTEGFEESEAFSFVLPDTLALAWEKLDVSKAILATQKILLNHPDSVATLGRLANYYGERGDKQEQLRILENVADLTTSDREAADSHFWLAKRYAEEPNGMSAAIEQARLAVKRNHRHYAAANLLAELLLAEKKAPEAIQVLDQIVKVCVLSVEDHARTESRVGRIWLEDLDRPDLARIHFERAVKIDGKNLEAMSYLEQILRDLDEHDQLVEILNQQYRVLEESGEPKNLEKLKEEIAKIYTGELGQLEKAVDLYLSSSSGLGVLEPDELASLFGFKPNKVNWDVLYESLKTNVLKLESQRDRAQLHVNLAKVCRTKLKDMPKAAKHLERAVRDGWVDAQSFEILSDYLNTERQGKKLAELILIRLDQIPDDQKPELIRQAIMVTDGLDDDKLDELVVQLVQLDADDNTYLYKRFDSYGRRGDLYRVKQLLDRVMVDLANQVQMHTWIDLAIENVGKSTEDTKFVLLDELFQIRLESCEDEIPVLNAAMEYLKDSPKQEMLAFYIRRLLEAGQIPTVDGEQIEKALNDAAVTGRFYELSADRTLKDEEKASLYKKAAACYEGVEQRVSERERCFGRYCALVHISPEEIAELRRMVQASGNWDLFVKALQKQIEITEDDEWKYLLWDELADIHWTRLDNIDHAIEALQQSVDVSPDIESTRYKLIDLLIEAGYNELEKEELQKYLADPTCVANSVHLRKLIDRMLLTHDMGEDVERMLKIHIQDFAEDGRRDLAGKLSDLLLENNMGEKDHEKGAFIGAVTRSDKEKAIELWSQMLLKMEESKAFARSFRWVKKALADNFTDITFDDLVASVSMLDESEFFSPTLHREFLMQIGISLLNSDSHNEIALASLIKVKEHNSDDKRLWVPLYLLMRDYSGDDEIKDYLSEVIPMIEREPAALKNYPMTLESLKAEYRRLVGLVGDEEDAADQVFIEAKGVVQQAAGAEQIPDMPVRTIEPVHLSEAIDAPIVQPSPSVTKKSIPVAKSDLPEPEEEAESKDSGEGDQSFRSSISQYKYEQNSISTRNGRQVDWRECIRTRNIPEGFASIVLNRAFSSAIEKHVAIQAAALVSGEMEVLEDWHWKVWRSPDQFGYSRSGKERYPSDMNPELLYSPLHRAVIYMVPAYVKLYSHRFKKSYLSRKMNVEPEHLPGLVKAIDWDHPLFRNSGLVHYLATIRKQKFRVFDAKGMGKKVFYEGSSRSVYIDVAYYMKMPPSVVFHRVYGLLWSVKLRYFVPLHLDPEKHIYSGYMELLRALNDGGLGWIKNAVGGGGDPISSALATIDKGELRRQMERVGRIEPNTMSTLWMTLKDHTFRLLLAETLDVIGLFESISGDDYVDVKELKPGQIYSESPFFASLLEYLTYLKL